jgi:hypothetical protein
MRVAALALSCCVWLSVPAVGFAQTPRPPAPETVVVAAAAPIFLYQDDQRIPLRTAAVGTVLQVIGVDGDWYNVRFQDPEYGPRVGYIQKKYLKTPDLTPMDLSVKPTPPASATEETRPRPVKPEATEPPPPMPEPNERALRRPDGGWFNIGLGVGSAGCMDCFDRLTGLSGGLSFGGAINDKVWLGFGTTGWTKLIDLDDRISISTADFLVRVYPAHRSGFFITGGVGFGAFQETDLDAQVGAGVVIGVGWDIPVGERVSITPFYNGFAMQNDLIDANVSQLGIGITIHRIR